MGWGNFFRKRSRDQEFDGEIAFHIDQLTQAGISEGLTPEEARRRAILEFGGREQIKQEVREVHTSAFLESIAINARAAMRFLRRSPSFSAAVILTLGLAIGANSAVFSAINAVILRPLPYPDGDQLIALHQHDSKNRNANPFVAPVRLEDWNRMNSTFQGITGYDMDDLTETSGPLPEKVTEALVAPRFLQVFGVSPALGRDFTAEEEHFGGPDAVLISYHFWQSRFQGDPAALGKKLHVGTSSYSIVGIMPASFAFPNRDVDFWAPNQPDAPYAQSRDATWYDVIGRLKPGVKLEQAQADLATVQNRLGKQFPKPDAELVVQSQPLKETVVSGVRDSLWLLYGSVTLLLLIACSNIAALLLARVADREHEISVRFTLGASRRAIIAQLLAEVFSLALLGSLLGLLVAAGASRGFHLLANTLPRAMEIRLDWRIALYSLLCAVATTLVCGLLPAMRGTRGDLARPLAQTSRTATARNPIQWFLVGVQVTLAVTLLTGAGLLLRSLQQLDRVSPGFDPAHVLTFQITGSWGETVDMPGLARRIDRTLDALRAIPGVAAASASGFSLPGVPNLYQLKFNLDGESDPNRVILADMRMVSLGYFDTMRIPLLQGESCKRDSDVNDMLVNRSFANMYLGNTPAAGHLLTEADENAYPLKGRIRGVVGDAREEGLNAAPVPTVYTCYTAANPVPNYLVRTHGDPMAMAGAIRRRIQQIEPNRSVYGMMPLQQHLDETSSNSRMRTILLALFAATAVSLACIGLYGTLNYLGHMRRREVGIRLALGAQRSQIVGLFVFKGLRVTLIGCVAGLFLSIGTDRLVAGMLYGVSPFDPVTYCGVLMLILIVATFASLLPAWRAARVEPVQVLRQE